MRIKFLIYLTMLTLLVCLKTNNDEINNYREEHHQLISYSTVDKI